MHIYLQTNAAPDSAPRYYHLILQEELLGGWSLLQEWGTQGSRGRSKRENFTNRSLAEQAMTKCRDIQLQHGFRIVFIQGDGATDT